MENGMIRMPLRLKWGKKSGRYDLSQEIYVLSVYVGDHLLVQCTLHSESTAHQCMHFLREKVELTQSNFFAFRYQMRCNDPDRRMMRWVEMNKPLRKQLEKYSYKKCAVHLAILFHTPNIFALSDPTARSLYYHLLKLDVLNGRLILDTEKYHNLAAYSLQVDYGDYEKQLHTMEFLRTLPLLPPDAIYERLSGMESSYAAFLYIVEVQQCEGYGEEFFNAKDDESTQIKIGHTQEGLVVKRCHGSPLKYRWQEIKDITSTKRCLQIKCKDSTSGVYTLEDTEMARYVAMVFCWQWQYYLTDAIQHKSVPMSINNLQGSIRTFGSQPPPSRYTSNDLMNSISANSEFGSSSITANSRHRYSAASSNRTTSSMYNINSVTPRNTPTVHAVKSFQHATNSTNRARSMTSTSNQLLSTAAGSAPSLVQHSVIDQTLSHTTVVTKPNVVYRPSMTTRDQSMTTSNVSPVPQNHVSDISADNTLEKERQSLKEAIEQQNSGNIAGSSPEIHMIGTGNSRNQNGSHFMRRAQSNVRGYPPNQSDRFFDEKVESLWSAIQTNSNQKQFDEQSVPSVSASSGSSSSRIAQRFALANNQPNRLYSNGHVISSSSASRPPGQSISYPLPQLDMSIPPPIYNGFSIPPTPLLRDRQQQSSPPAHFYYQQGSQSVTSTDSSRRLNVAESDTQSLNENDIELRSASRSSQPTAESTDPNMLNQSKHALLNGVAKSGALNSMEQKPLTSTDKMDTRVMLPPTKRNLSGYINASNVQIPIGSKLLRYIISQHPMKSVIDDFWQMIWISKAQLIVSLVNPHQEKLTVDGYSITQTQKNTTDKYQTTTSVLLLKCRNGQRRTVYHVQTTDINDEGLPSVEGFLAFVDGVNSIKRHIENERLSGVEASKSRSKSLTRSNLIDVTNRSPNDNAEGSSSGWKRKLRFTASPSGHNGSIHSEVSESSKTSSTISQAGDEHIGILDDGSESVEPPVVVHCTNGANESGIFCLVDALIQSVENNIEIDDVPALLKLLRDQRMMLIKNAAEEMVFGYLAAAVAGSAILYANLPTRLTLGSIYPTAAYLSQAKILPIEKGKDAANLFEKGPVLVMAVRRPGCMFCRREAEQLNTLKDKFDRKNIKVIGVLHELEGAEEFRPFLKGDLYFDPEKHFYGPSQRWLPFWMGGLRFSTYYNAYLTKKDNVKGNMKGEGRLLGGVYLIKNNELAYVHLEGNEEFAGISFKNFR
ncbi:FERM domain-containing protein [Aphelenchoides besseyi]|nr:FERM domain-containing protein [Aphelenchoides besseyi]